MWGETAKGRGNPGSYGGREEGREESRSSNVTKAIKRFYKTKGNKKNDNQPQIEVLALCNRTGTILYLNLKTCLQVATNFYEKLKRQKKIKRERERESESVNRNS